MGAVLQFFVKASFGAEKLVVVFFLPSGDSQPSKGTSLFNLKMNEVF